MSEERKPCPFCEHPSELFYGNTTFVYCPLCGSKGQSCPEDDIAENVDKQNAINAWNTRPIEDALNKRIEELTIPDDVMETLIECVEYTDEQCTGGQYWHDSYKKALDWLKARSNA